MSSAHCCVTLLWKGVSIAQTGDISIVAPQALQHSGGELSGSGARGDGGSGGGGSSSGRSESPISQAESSASGLQPEQSGASFAALLRGASLREAPEPYMDHSEIVGGPDARDGSGVRVRLKNYFSRQKQGE